MPNKIRMTIGEFSKFCQVTVKTLHYYDKMGLLVPNEVNEWSHYRYYDVSQMQQLNAILRLKDMGFSLEEIGDLLNEGTHKQDLTPIFTKTINPEIQRIGCKRTLPIYGFMIEHEKEYKKETIDIEYCLQVEEMYEDTNIIKFKRLPEVPMAVCLKHVGTYDLFPESFAKVMRYIEDHHYKMTGEYHIQFVSSIQDQRDPEKYITIIQVPVTRNE